MRTGMDGSSLHPMIPIGPTSPMISAARGARRGMTLVEVVCALAVMALAVAAALGALGVAARGALASRQAMRDARAENGLARMMREDLWGLALLSDREAGEFVGRQPGADESGVFLEFNTLRTLEARGWSGPRGLRRVKYSLRLGTEGWQVWRAEAAREPGKEPAREAFWEERVTQGTWTARMGFYDGQVWRQRWSEPGAPKAARLVLSRYDSALAADVEQVFVFETWAGGAE